LKAPPGAAGTEVIAAELLGQLLVAVDHAQAAADLRFGGISPSSAYSRARKEGSSSTSFLRTAHLPFIIAAGRRERTDYLTGAIATHD
jgi:hypothetical protein